MKNRSIFRRGAGLCLCALLSLGSVTGAFAEETASVTFDVCDIVEMAMPTVVSITTVSIEEVEDYYSYFFYGYSNPDSKQHEVTGAGSGIIIEENEDELMVVTNYHVVEGAKDVSVTFVDGESYEASIRGYDEDNDIAIVTLQRSSLSKDTLDKIKIAELGSSDETRVGEQVVAIGNALGYGQSVTTGIISAKNRVILGNRTITNAADVTSDMYISLLQTDAAINPGNSGGALLNMDGKVIGINSAKTATTAVEGCCYAIAISSVTDLIQELTTEEVREKLGDNEHGMLGIIGTTVTETDHNKFGFPMGVYISEITEGSGAEKAGLKTGWIVTHFGSRRIATIQELVERVSYYHEGETVSLTIMVPEDGEYHEKVLEVTLGENSNKGKEEPKDENSEKTEKKPESSDDEPMNPFSFSFPQN